ncbi:hypothetical protein CDO52_26535 [Nocardiopsis gilva YIM 90087]|uniref:ATP-binding protein n=1 Tax=Nocardiopsis gilva YIM 90087 TaxID=1235441 RepID=A0A223SCS9_9ACTN|nr:ATP-binding protein [Nocardiopsis gilva]ASU85883.1 hypothetical protein CDO52_26535 [Nocardiopsis gilva YIM 90087]
MFLRHDPQPDVTTVYLPGLCLGEVRSARDCVACLLRDEDPDIRDTATLLTSELAANALIHGDVRNAACPKSGRLAHIRPFHITVEILTREICVLVCGKGSRNARVRPKPQHTWNETGHGLAWVEAMSTAWGTHGDRISRTVWFILDRASAPVVG